MSFLAFEDVSYTDIPENSGLEFESKLPVVHKVWKCPVCERKYNTKEALYDHTYKEHIDMIPEGMSAAQYLFNIRNKKSFGLCVQCRTNHTPWNEEAERYDRFCGPACRQAYIVEAKRRMVNKYGKEHLLDDPEMQVKMPIQTVFLVLIIAFIVAMIIFSLIPSKAAPSFSSLSV